MRKRQWAPSLGRALQLGDYLTTVLEETFFSSEGEATIFSTALQDALKERFLGSLGSWTYK